MKRDVIVIGGGAVGLMCAYMLNKDGKNVTVIDKKSITDGTSFGNAGILSPFEKYPLASPGIIVKTIKLMLKGKSPMLLNPTLNPKIIKWLMKFMLNANEDRLKKTMALFEKYGELSLTLYKEIIKEHSLDFDFHDDGLLLVFTELETFQKRLLTAHDPSKYTILSPSQTNEYLPFVKQNICGSLLINRNAHLDPALMMKNMKTHLEKAGVEFILNEEIIDFEFSQDKLVKIVSKENDYEADEFIFSTGAHVALAKKAGTDLMLTPAKGYSITFEMPEHLKPKRATLFNDLFIFCTPRKNDVRLTGKLEIASNNPEVVQARIDSILKNLKEYSIDFEMKNEKLWAGFRPLTPNDMPLIGRDDRYKNLTYATGLGWLGITFAPAIGKIISDLIVENKENIKSDDILLFSGFYQG